MTYQLILSIISGIITGLSFNQPGFSFLVWVSLVPFLFAISQSTFKRGIFCSFLFGLSFFGTVLFWVGNVTKLGLVFLLIYLSLYTILFFLAAYFLFKKPFRIVTLAALWVVVEFLQEHIWCGFGWADLGYSQFRNLALIQIADLGGVKLISFLIVLINVFIWETMLKERLEIKKAISIVILFLAVFSYSFFRLNTLKSDDFLEVSLVQTNIAESQKWNEPIGFSFIDNYLLLSEKADKDSLVILPEASWPFVVDYEEIKVLKEFAKKAKRELLIGAVTKKGPAFYNSALLFNKEGELLNLYHKIKLVPFGEYVPLRKYFGFISALNMIGDMIPGKEITVFDYMAKKYTVLICFEDLFPLFVRNFAKKSDFLVNITNDEWFGGEPEASQHLGVMCLRAVENRISIVRCANTGISGVVSFRGEIKTLQKDSKEIFFAGTDNFRVELNKERSFYNKTGDIFPFLCAIFLVSCCWRRHER